MAFSMLPCNGNALCCLVWSNCLPINLYLVIFCNGTLMINKTMSILDKEDKIQNSKFNLIRTPFMHMIASHQSHLLCQSSLELDVNWHVPIDQNFGDSQGKTFPWSSKPKKYFLVSIFFFLTLFFLYSFHLFYTALIGSYGLPGA